MIVEVLEPQEPNAEGVALGYRCIDHQEWEAPDTPAYARTHWLTLTFPDRPDRKVERIEFDTDAVRVYLHGRGS